MLENWLKPLPKTLLNAVEQHPEMSLGRQVLLHRTGLPDLKQVRIAIIGADAGEADAVRKMLYPMSYPFLRGSIADLGNLRRTEPSVLIPVLLELLHSKILPVVIARNADLARAQFLAYQEKKALVNLAVIDETFCLSGARAIFAPILQPRHPQLFHFGAIGFQSHQTAPEALHFLQENHFDALRLGKSRQAIEETEPVLRDADLLAFHLGALKQSEAPAVERPSPSGYFTEEACQLCRYAGMSDKLTTFGIYGFRAERDPDGQSAQTIAQMCWYFLEGFFNRKNDFPASKDGLTEYIVDFRRLQHQLTFWKSTRSGRWWMEVPAPPRKKHQRHYLVPCSFQDYQAACRDELPDRLLQALGRLG